MAIAKSQAQYVQPADTRIPQAGARPESESLGGLLRLVKDAYARKDNAEGDRFYRQHLRLWEQREAEAIARGMKAPFPQIPLNYKDYLKLNAEFIESIEGFAEQDSFETVKQNGEAEAREFVPEYQAKQEKFDRNQAQIDALGEEHARLEDEKIALLEKEGLGDGEECAIPSTSRAYHLRVRQKDIAEKICAIVGINKGLGSYLSKFEMNYKYATDGIPVISQASFNELCAQIRAK